MARTYAKVVGVVVLIVGILGFVMGDDIVGFNSDLVEDIIHLVTGGLLAYVGFAGSDSAVRSTVLGLGVVYLLVGIVGFMVPGMFGLMPTELGIYDHILHLVLGVLGIGAAMSGRTTTTTTA